MGPAGALILVGCCYSGPKGAGPIRSPPWFPHGPPPLEESDLSTTALNTPPHTHTPPPCFPGIILAARPRWQGPDAVAHCDQLMAPWQGQGSVSPTSEPLSACEHFCPADTTDHPSYPFPLLPRLPPPWGKLLFSL